MKLESLGFRERFDILSEKRRIGVAELRYKRLYGRCKMNKHTRREFMAACTATAVSLWVSDVLGAAPKKQPSLLFVMTD